MSLPPRNAILISAYYFFLYGAIGCLIPYIPLYYQKIGLSGEQMGLLLGVGPIVLLVAGPLWGAIGDRFNIHRRLLPLVSIGALVPFFFLPFSNELTWLIIIILIQSSFATAIGPLIDSAALEIAEQTDTPFGQMRLGGSIGFTLLTTLMGWLLTFLPLITAFYAYMIAMGVATLIALPLPARQHQLQGPMLHGLGALLSRPALLLFLGATYLIGTAGNAVQSFFPLFLQNIGGDSTMLGIASATGAMAEIPIMFAGNRIIKRLGSVWAGVALGAFFYMLRWVLLSFATTPGMVVLIQLMHGLSFGLFIISAMAYVQTQAPPGLSATAQALFTVALWGIGAFTGSVGGGWVYEQAGAVVLFQSAALACVLALGLLFGSRAITPRTL